MDAVLLKKSHEDKFLEAGFYLALQFKTGWVVARILGREPANLRPYSVGAVVAGANLAAWNEILDASAKHYLDASRDRLIHHIFWGINTPNARVYVQYPTKSDIGSLTTTTRVVGGDVGYIPGEDSPYEGPFSVNTELFTVHERYPALQVSNVTADAFANVMFNFSVMKYTYHLIKDKKLLEQLLVGGKICRKYTMGPVDPQPTTVPQWLQQLVGDELIRWTEDLVESDVSSESSSSSSSSSSERGAGVRREDVERAAAHFNVPTNMVTREMIAALPGRGTGLSTGRARR